MNRNRMIIELRDGHCGGPSLEQLRLPAISAGDRRQASDHGKDCGREQSGERHLGWTVRSDQSLSNLATDLTGVVNW